MAKTRRLRVDAREEGYRIRFMKTKETREELYDARLGAGSGSLCTKDLETLHKVDRATNQLRLRLKYHPIKANIVTDALSRKESLRPSRKFEVWLDGVRYLKGRAWIPRIDNLRDVILDEAYRWRYLIHPGANKMYQDVKEYYWWHGMKKDIALYVRKCLTCAKNDERSRLHMGYSGTVDEFSALPPDERRLQNGEASTDLHQ
ncbi:putative reverse transcriptase domain-containing protein [Tanacetum coccineum]